LNAEFAEHAENEYDLKPLRSLRPLRSKTESEVNTYQNYIAGADIAAADGRTFTAFNPTTGGVWGTFGIEAVHQYLPTKSVWCELGDEIQDPFIMKV
jgi:hypothetical protein